MKLYVLSGMLMSMFVCSAVLCQEPGLEEDPEYQMELHKMQLELRELETEVEFQREMRELELQQRRTHLEHEQAPKEHPDHRDHRDKGGAGVLLLLCAVVHILVAVWVYSDIRKRNYGSGIWIVIALLTGLLGALVYAVVRLGDARQNQG